MFYFFLKEFILFIYYFFKKIIPNVKNLILFDVDTMVTKPLENTWKKFSEFEPNEVMGASPDCVTEK